LALSQGAKEEGLQLLSLASARAPQDLSLRAELAQELLLQRRSGEALPLLQSLMETAQPERSWGLLLVEALIFEGAPARALAWSETLSRGSDDREFKLLKLYALIVLQRSKEAQILEEQLSDSLSPIERSRLTLAYQRRGEPEEVERRYLELRRRHPEFLPGWLNHSRWLLQRGDSGGALRLLEAASRRLPQEASLYSAQAALLKERHPRAAQAALLKAIRCAPEQPELQAQLAELLWKGGAHGAAIVHWKFLLKLHPQLHEVRLSLARALESRGLLPEAFQEFEILAKLQPQHPELLLSLGAIALKQGQPAQALRLLRRAESAQLKLPELQSLLAMSLASQGKGDEAIPYFQRALKAQPSHRGLRLSFARFLELRQRPEEATSLYRQQLARDPRDKLAQEGLLRSAGALDPEPWRAARDDPELRRLCAGLKSDQAPGVILRDHRHVKVGKAGVERIQLLRSILIQRPEGIPRYSVASLGFRDGYPPRLIRAYTLSPEGESLPLKAQKVVDPHADQPHYGDTRLLQLHFQGVEPGAILEYELEMPHPQPLLEGLWWDRYPLSNPDPTLEARYELEIPKGQPLHLLAHKLAPPQEQDEGAHRRLIWSAQDLASESPSKQLPVGVYLSNVKSWAQIDHWYHGLFAPRAQASPVLRRLVSDLRPPGASRRARIAAIYAFVERMEYLALEFGEGAYRPRPLETTLARRSGDCKDMTALMVALLAAEEIPAWPALLSPPPHADLQSDDPSPGQFSHVILYLPDPQGDLWLDATAKLGTLEAIPQSLQGRWAFVVDGEGGRLLKIPERSDSNRLHLELSYRLNRTGGGRLKSLLRLEGDLAGRARRELAQGRPLYTPGLLLPLDHSPDEVKLSARTQPQEPLSIEAQLSHSDLVALRRDGALMIPSPILLFQEELTQRHLFDEAPRELNRNLKIYPPPGYRREGPLIRFKRHIEGASLSVLERREGESVEVHTQLQVKRWRLNIRELFRGSERALRPLLFLPPQGFDPKVLLKEISERAK